MKRKHVFSILFLAVMVVVASCNDRHRALDIDADLDNAKVLSLTPERIMWFETSDSSVLYDISNVNFMGNDRMVVQSRNFINLYDTAGNFLKTVTRKGDSPSDFTWLSGCMWSNDTVFYLVDCISKRVQKYNRDAQYLGYDSIPERKGGLGMLEDVYQTETGGVFYINSCVGSDGAYDVFSYSPVAGRSPDYIPGRKRTDGHTFYNRVSIIPGKDQLVYWEPLVDTIFSVTKEGVEPWFVLDFGKYDLVPEIKALPYLYDRLDMQHELHDKEMIGVLRYFQPHGKYLYFITSMLKKGYIGCVDPEKGKAAMTQIVDTEGELLPQLFFKLHDGKAYISVIDEKETEKNPGLFVIPIDSLAKP